MDRHKKADMKAIVLNKPGGPESFSIQERPIPKPVEGWVLIKVKAFGLNRSELMTRKGLSPNVSFPRILGIECVAEVENDPSGKFKPGQKVAAFMGGMGRDFDGSYAEYAVLPIDLLSPFESTLEWQQLAAIPEMFQTVHGSLHLALKVNKGDSILIRGGTSSIGMLAIQMARIYGLKVIATTRNMEKSSLLLNNGAHKVLIDSGKLKNQIREIETEGVDKVLELIGTATLKDSLACSKRGGIVCMTGMLSEEWAFHEFAPMEAIPATVSLTTYDSGQIRVGEHYLQQFIEAVEKGAIRLNIASTFRLEEITQAHQFMESNTAAGKIVILT